MKLPYAQDQLILELLKAKPGYGCGYGSRLLRWRWGRGFQEPKPWSGTGTPVWRAAKPWQKSFSVKSTPRDGFLRAFLFLIWTARPTASENFPAGKTVAYREGIFVGYRYYETRQMAVAFRSAMVFPTRNLPMSG